MSWIPSFEIGLWNAWIPMLVLALQPLILFAVDKAVGTGEVMKKMGSAPTGQKEKRLYAVYAVIQLALMAYSIFLPLKLGTLWFYAGLAIYLVGLALLLPAMANAAAAPAGGLFTQGLYRYSRHPLYLSSLMLFIGVGMASASWLFLLLSAVLVALQTSQVAQEERACLEMFGDEYRDYMKRTPRWIGLPKSK